MKKNILVFPCGSEVALEIHRSMRYSLHFHLIGGSSVDDHGRFVFDDYVPGLPFHDSADFVPALKRVIQQRGIDAIFPAMDAVAKTLKSHEAALGCRVIGSDVEVTRLCASKSATYSALEQRVPCPAWTARLEEVVRYPVFIKPDEGYGSRHVCLAQTPDAARAHVDGHPDKTFVFCDWLPGKEYTVDCFSDRQGRLLFHGARCRQRVSNGISVNTVEADRHLELFERVAHAINESLRPRGAWFFQMKEDREGEPALMEVAARLGGSSSYFRAKGVNFALLSAFDAFDLPVAVQPNEYAVELDRALNSRFKLKIDYDTVYVDFDDCLIIDHKVNTELVGFLYQAINQGKTIVLITRHEQDLAVSLEAYRLTHLFDRVIHLDKRMAKSRYIEPGPAIFIDDSFAEREDVSSCLGIPVFAPDMIEMLVD